MLNEISISLILVFSVLFYFGIIFYQKKHKIFPFSADILSQKPLMRLPFFDYAKGVAVLAIFIYHISYLLNFVSENFPDYFITWSQYINRLVMFAIPVFFISSGALLTIPNFEKKNIWIFYKSKLKKLLIPYLVFSFPAIFLLFFCLTEGKNNIFISLLVLPFWFIPFLLMLYLLYPGLWYLLAIKKIRPRLFLFFTFVFAVGYYVLSVYWSGWPFGNSVFGLYIFFFALGIVLKPMIFLNNREWLRKIYLPFWSILALIFYFGIGLISSKEGLLNCQFIYGPIVFLLLFYYFNWFSRFSFAKFIQKIGENSLYFYLIHFYVLAFLINMIKFFNLFYINPVVIFTGLFIFGFLITYFLVFGIIKFSGNYIKTDFNYSSIISSMRGLTYSAARYSKKSIKKLLFRLLPF
ncbi:MAG: acyltransferase [Candidatus Nealsonbacteria bacterium]|nr:acyltransferase [Candidatus Nealsonbacteria bacterium]